MLKDETLEICIGGDFNGHIGVNDGFGQQVGNKGLQTPTTLGGRLLKEFVATSDLVHLDSWKPIKHRGTWRHARTSQWYELDGFLLSSSLYTAVQPGMSTFSTSGILSDHMGKRMHLHLGSLEKHAVRKARKMLWKRRSRGRVVADQKETRVRCNASALRGNSAETLHRIEQCQKLVESCMDELQVSPVPAAPATVEGWEEQDASALHIYTDGGAPPIFRDNKVQVPSTAGWGLAAWLAGDVQDYFGPVVCSPTESGFLGAQRATNNTGELSAVIKAFQLALSQASSISALHIHFDSQYACNVAQGLWKVNKKAVLARRAQKLWCRAKQLFPVHWHWVKGHTGNRGNERADDCATMGKNGQWQDLPGHCSLRAELGLKSATRRRLQGKQPPVASQVASNVVPPPEVDWAELSQLLVGCVDILQRQTSRCSSFA